MEHTIRAMRSKRRTCPREARNLLRARASHAVTFRQLPTAMKTALAILLASAAPAFAAAPVDVPPLRPGLWEATTVPANRSQPRPEVTRVCIDKFTQRQVLDQLAFAMPRMCSRNQYGMRGGRFVTESACTLGASTIEGRTETTFFRDTGYHTEVVGRVGPAGKVAPTQRAVIDGKHVGACPAGMKPGDMVLPNGLTLNLVQMSLLLAK